MLKEIPVILKGFTSTYSNTIFFVLFFLALIAIIIVPNYDQISEKFGFQTRETLRVDKAVQQKTIDIISQVNADLSKEIDNQTKSEQITIDSLIQDKKNELNTQEVSVSIEKKRKTKITKIKETKSNPNEVTQKEISQANITSIWETYCSFNSNPDCTKITEAP